MTTSGQFTSSGSIIYPCDRGTGTPVGYHKFGASGGVAVCEYCGKFAAQAPKPQRPPYPVWDGRSVPEVK